MSWIGDKNKWIGFWFGSSRSVGCKTWTVSPGRGMRFYRVPFYFVLFCQVVTMSNFSFVYLFVCRISHKVVDGSGWNFVDRLGVRQGRTNSILVKVRIRMQLLEFFLSDSSPLRDIAKNDIVLYGMIFQKCIGPDVFSWIRHYVAEVCALPSALLVYFISHLGNIPGTFWAKKLIFEHDSDRVIWQ